MSGMLGLATQGMGKDQIVFAMTVVACSLVGLAIGSFLNVVVHRVPAGESVVSPPSSCPRCKSLIAPRDNIPVVSWVLLGGKCRACRAPIAVRYPAVEALTAILFAVMAVRFGSSWTLPAELAFVGGLMALACIDLERYLLPRAVVYPTLGLVSAGLVLAASLTGEWRRLVVAAICGVAELVFFLLIHLARPQWMGFGDVRLAGLLGLALGWVGPWYPLIGLIAANLAGALVGGALMATGRATRRTALPYGVFLGAGAVLSLLLGASIIAWYSHDLIR